MKLITRTILYFISIALIVFSAGGLIFYYYLLTAATADADERLMQEKAKVLNYIKINNELPRNAIAFDDTLTFTETGKPFSLLGIKDTTLYTKYEKNKRPYRVIEFPASTDKYYRAAIFKPVIETGDLSRDISRFMLVAGGILLALLILMDTIVTKKSWKPFYQSLEKLKASDLINGEQIALGESKTTGFKSLSDMPGNMGADYKTFNAFTESASREMQASLADIQSKIESLMQSKNLSSDQRLNARAIYKSASKLCKLNRGLLLLVQNMRGVKYKNLLRKQE